MNVIGGDNEINQVITLPVEKLKRRFHGSAISGVAKRTTPVGRIQPRLQASGKQPVEFLAGWRIMRLGVLRKPLFQFLFPHIQLGLRKRIGGPKGHKISHSVLTPVWQVSR